MPGGIRQDSARATVRQADRPAHAAAGIAVWLAVAPARAALRGAASHMDAEQQPAGVRFDA